MNTFHRIFSVSFTALAVMILMAPIAFAYVASSSSYRVQSDSINVGGVISTSTSYTAEDTIGESGVGTSSSASYNIKAGYQQMQEVYIAVTAPGNISLAPNIPSNGGGISNGQSVWTVTTDNSAGYSVNIRASGTPALVSGANSFTDYVPSGADPDLTFTTPVGTSRFGFSPEGADIVQKYLNNGAICNAGAINDINTCWAPLLTTSDTITQRNTPNHPSGTVTTVRFRAESESTNIQAAGSYTATATLTILPN
ncbi:MAG: hypothetical protein UY04_C0011G0020 [Parcubacteria group bacterium GW2011_GWA2_47_7]|nr:MAG: hypothetical protein UY04_C0011G0020 [Parcubacteria group bacterium GW2011_GWA2_47_7]